MSGWEEVVKPSADTGPSGLLMHRKAAIAGQVIDAATRTPIAGAVIELLDGPQRFMNCCRTRTVMTRLDGSFCFDVAVAREQAGGTVHDIIMRERQDDGTVKALELDKALDEQPCTLRASAPQLGSRYAVDSESVEKLPTLDLTFELQPTRLVGTVNDTGGQPLAGVRVALVGGDAHIWTDAEGTFILAPIPSGTWTVVASRAGYVDPSSPAGQLRPEVRKQETVKQGQGPAINFVLRKKSNGQPE